MICSSGVSFDPRLDGKRLTFGFEGVWKGTAILYDRDTGSLWMHFTGACFAGPRAGRSLPVLPTGTHTTWGAWRRAFPDTDVMAPDARFSAVYFDREQSRSGRAFLPPQFAETIGPRDPRLVSHALLLGVLAGGEARAYPLSRLAATEGVVTETVGGVPVTVWYEAASRTACAFDARLDGGTRAFERRPEGFFDRETGSRFDLEGRCVEGPLLGRTLARATSLLTEWYGWSAHHPKTTIFGS